MLPTIRIGNQDFIDMTLIITPNRAQRVRTIGFSWNHSVGQTEFPDRNANGTTMDEEIAHIKAINDYHIRQNYGGFGYTAIGFTSGRVYAAGDGLGQRAHVAYRNHELEGFCLAGTFTTADVPLGLVLGAGRWLYAKRQQYGDLPSKGHGQWAVPGWETSCPGEGGLRAIPNIIRVADQLARGEADKVAAEAQQAIANALIPAAKRGDFETLAAQIAWLTGRRLCG